MENTSEIKPYLRFTVFVAVAQLVSVFSAIYIAWYSGQQTGKDTWIIFYMFIPGAFMVLTAPINVISAPFYFFKYRNDALRFKVIVGLAFVSSVLFLFFFNNLR